MRQKREKKVWKWLSYKDNAAETMDENSPGVCARLIWVIAMMKGQLKGECQLRLRIIKRIEALTNSLSLSKRNQLKRVKATIYGYLPIFP